MSEAEERNLPDPVSGYQSSPSLGRATSRLPGGGGGGGGFWAGAWPRGRRRHVAVVIHT